MQNHVDITFDFCNIDGMCIDLRLPTLQPVQALLDNICQVLNISLPTPVETIRVKNKNIIIGATETLAQAHVTTGDILTFGVIQIRGEQ